MRFFYGLTTVLLTITLFSQHGLSLPTEKYKSHLDLLKKEKKLLKKEAIYYTAAPWPIPLVSNAVSGSTAWNKYYKCNKMYLYFKSARIIVNSEEDSGKYKKPVTKKAYNRLVDLLEKTRKESKEASEKKSGLIGRSDSQKALDERIGKMTISELAHILNRADKSIPPSCGNPFSGVPEIRGYNLRYQLRTASLYHSGKSNLEYEIEVEEKKMTNMTQISNEGTDYQRASSMSETDLESSSSSDSHHSSN